MPRLSEKLVDAILRCGDAYREKNLSGWDQELLADDWRWALKFFLGRACYQGRRDPISDRVYDHARTALLDVFQSPETSLDEAHLAEFRSRLQGGIGPGKVGKRGDVQMILDACRFIAELPGRNLVNYSVSRVRSGETHAHYRELQRSVSPGGIFQVGPKIASFYLRDLVSLMGLESEVPVDVQFWLQPVDVWVERVCVRARLVDSEKPSTEEVRTAIMRVCAETGCSPIRFNQGTWFLGYHAFDLLLDELS